MKLNNEITKTKFTFLKYHRSNSIKKQRELMPVWIQNHTATS